MPTQPVSKLNRHHLRDKKTHQNLSRSPQVTNTNKATHHIPLAHQIDHPPRSSLAQRAKERCKGTVTPNKSQTPAESASTPKLSGRTDPQTPPSPVQSTYKTPSPSPANSAKSRQQYLKRDGQRAVPITNRGEPREAETTDLVDAEQHQSAKDKAIDQHEAHQPPTSRSLPSSLKELVDYCLKSNDINPCSLCYEEHQPGDRFTVLSCSHVFHNECLTNSFHFQQAQVKNESTVIRDRRNVQSSKHYVLFECPICSHLITEVAHFQNPWADHVKPVEMWKTFLSSLISHKFSTPSPFTSVKRGHDIRIVKPSKDNSYTLQFFPTFKASNIPHKPAPSRHQHYQKLRTLVQSIETSTQWGQGGDLSFAKMEEISQIVSSGEYRQDDFDDPSSDCIDDDDDENQSVSDGFDPGTDVFISFDGSAKFPLSFTYE